jgi:hypothetical protein
LDFVKRTKAVAFADGLLIAMKAECAKEAENLVNVEISKGRSNKIMFNEQR